MTQIKWFEPQAFKTCTNSYGMEIMINETFEEVSYKYTDEDQVSTTSISYDMDGDPYFHEYRGPYEPTVHYISEFLKISK